MHNSTILSIDIGSDRCVCSGNNNSG